MTPSTPYYEFALTPSGPAPSADLSSFTATVRPEGVRLHWVVLSDEDTQGFAIERRSDLSSAWELITFLEREGEVGQHHAYTYLDSQAKVGDFHYRLRQIDRVGTKAISYSVQVNAGRGPARFALGNNYPNPCTSSTALAYVVREEAPITIVVTDSMGRDIMMPVNSTVEPGTYTLHLDLHNMPSGLYFVRMTSSDFEDSQLIFKR